MRQKLKATPIMMILFKDISLLEHDAQTQYKFNRFWAIVWCVAMIGIPFDSTLYGHSVGTLIIEEVSLWANFATHFGAMSAALAAKNTTKAVGDTAVVMNNLDDNLDDVQDGVDQIVEVLSGE